MKTSWCPKKAPKARYKTKRNLSQDYYQIWFPMDRSPKYSDYTLAPLLTAKRARNLSDVRVHSEYKQTENKKWLSIQRPPLGMPAGVAVSVRLYTKPMCSPIPAEIRTTKSIIICPCNKMYVGKTKRQLCIRIGEHISSIKKKDDDRPIPYILPSFTMVTQKL